MSRLLLVEDDVRMAEVCARVLGRLVPTQVFHRLADAEAALDDGESWAGAIVDQRMPDGEGLEFLARHPELRGDAVALVTGDARPAVTRRAFELGVAFLVKPADPELLRQIARRALERNKRRSAPPPAVHSRTGLEEAQVLAFCRAHKLSPRRTQIVLLAAVEGHYSKDIGERLGMAEGTRKTHVAKIALATGAGSLREVVEMIRVWSP